MKRNLKRFPSDFSFILTTEEASDLRSQIAILTRGRGRHRKYVTRVFTEHSALMAASILNSERAIAMSVYVICAFVELRGRMGAQAEILKRLAQIDRDLLSHDGALGDIYEKLLPLLNSPDTPRRQIGFGAS